jgi:hypothetical protein
VAVSACNSLNPRPTATTILASIACYPSAPVILLCTATSASSSSLRGLRRCLVGRPTYLKQANTPVAAASNTYLLHLSGLLSSL